MTIRQLSDFAQIEQLYNTRLAVDFPPDELKTLQSMWRSWKQNAYDCYGLFEEDEMLGYAFFVRREKDYLFDYFAIAEEHRNEGMGSFFLSELESCLQGADCVLCEVEDPDTDGDEEMKALEERRLQFYLRNGYRKTEVTANVFDVDYRILELPTAREHTTEELRQIYTEIYRSTMTEEIFRAKFRLN